MTNPTVPFDKIVKFGQKSMLSRPMFVVSWILGRFCNYKCSYYWLYANTSKVDFHQLDIYKKAMDEIKLQAKNNGFTEFVFDFSGGEPTAYKDFRNLIKYYAKDNSQTRQSIRITTNLSPGKTWWKSWSEITESFEKTIIAASFHSEFADITEFSDKCLQLKEAGTIITVNLVMTPEKFFDLYEIAHTFSNLGISVTLKPQSDPTASQIISGYSAEMIELMKTKFPQKLNDQPVYQISLYDGQGEEYHFDKAERFNVFGFNKFKGWMCNSGYQSVIIRGNEVKRSYSCQDKILGTLSEGFKLFDSPKICITPSCVSSADSKIPKSRNE